MSRFRVIHIPTGIFQEINLPFQNPTLEQVIRRSCLTTSPDICKKSFCGRDCPWSYKNATHRAAEFCFEKIK